MIAEKYAHGFNRLVFSRIPFKRLFDNGGAFAVNDDAFGAIIVNVADWSHAGIFTPPDFFTKSALGVFGKRINVVFAESKIVVKHELSLWGVLEPRAGEFERFDFVRVEHVNDAPAVHAVASQTVGMPRENSTGFTGFNPCEHFIENRSAGNLGGLFFNQLGDNRDLFAHCKFAQFIDLRVNGENLLVLNVGGFAGVEKKLAV